MIYQDIKYNQFSTELINQLEKGIFMTTKNGDKINTMTIAWGGINFVWHKPVFVAYVRYTRNTYEILNSTDEFSISVPLSENMKKELTYCGTKSGRDFDKISDCDLKLLSSRKIQTPILSDCELHYECKIIYRQAMEPSSLPTDIKKRYYAKNDFHVIFYGEIVDSYIIKGD